MHHAGDRTNGAVKISICLPAKMPCLSRTRSEAVVAGGTGYVRLSVIVLDNAFWKRGILEDERLKGCVILEVREPELEVGGGLLEMACDCRGLLCVSFRACSRTRT